MPDRDALVPPKVTINEHDGVFDVVESGEVIVTTDTHEKALADARQNFGEDVEIVTDAAPASVAVQAAPVPEAEPQVMPPSEEQ